MAVNRRSVTPKNGGGWKITKAGAKRASATATTQAAAISKARKLLKNSGGGS